MNKALQIGHNAAESAADHEGSIWKIRAYSVVVNYAKSHEFFTIEEVALAYGNDLKPINGRSWGYIAKEAAKSKIIAREGYINTTKKSAHGALATYWKSLIVDDLVRCRNEYKRKYKD